jgi:polysaccharide biosynthesis/export protein
LSGKQILITTPGVIGLLSFDGSPAVILDDEIEAVRSLARSGRNVGPWPYLREGEYVLINASGEWGLTLNITYRHTSTLLAALIGFISFISNGPSCEAQQSAIDPASIRSSPNEQESNPKNQTASSQKRDIPTGYILGPADQITIHVVNLDEINDKPLLIDLSGCIRLPMVGQIMVAGLTVEQVASEVGAHLAVYMKHPDVSVSVTEFRSQPVSVIGSVRNPGLQQVQGQKKLLEMLSLAGGIDNTTAGSTLKITRRLEWGPIPLPTATNDPSNQFSVAQVSIKSLLDASKPGENIQVKPYDVISVPRGETVYVIGQVVKPGGQLVNDSDQITALQALSMAGGLDKMAQPQHSRILRRVPGEPSRIEIPIDITRILNGKSTDVRMQSEDILFVPNSVPKRAAIRALEAAIQMGSIAILRP